MRKKVDKSENRIGRLHVYRYVSPTLVACTGIVLSVILFVIARDWDHTRIQAGFERAADTWLPWGLLAGGFLFTGCLTAYIFSILRYVVRTRQFAADVLRTKHKLEYEIVDRKKAEDKIIQAAQNWRATFDSIPDMVFIVDKEYRLVRVNKAFADAHKTTPKEAIGKFCFEVVHGTDKPVKNCPHWEVIESMNTSRQQLHLPQNETYVELLVSPIVNDQGEAIATVHIIKDITEQKEAETELAETHKQLVETSRLAGRAEVAGSVLHNVGNVLNSVNVSTALMTEKVNNLKVEGLAKATHLLCQHLPDLTHFVTQDERGKQLPDYLATVAEHFACEQNVLLGELQSLTQNVEHINNLVAMQQAYAGIAGIIETIRPCDLAEDAIWINIASLERHQIQLLREYDEIPPVQLEKHKLLQILVNLISNAKYALIHSDRTDKQIIVRLQQMDDDLIRFQVIDNGVGIPKSNLARIFSHGFTTKKDGHGFGLHSSALAARDMGGSLTVCSAGPNQGAIFTLDLPVTVPETTR